MWKLGYKRGLAQNGPINGGSVVPNATVARCRDRCLTVCESNGSNKNLGKRRMKHLIGSVLACLTAMAGCTPSFAQGSPWPGRIEILPVKSQTLALDAFLRGREVGPEVLLGGELRLPLGPPAGFRPSC